MCPKLLVLPNGCVVPLEWANIWDKVSILATNHPENDIIELDFKFIRQVNALVHD